MKRLTALAVIAVIAVLAIGAMTTSSAHAGGGTVDGLSRQSTSACSVGNPNCAWINFQGRWTWAVKYATGQGVFGAHVLTGTSINNGYLTGSDRGSCFFVSAPTNGFVVDGTAHYWVGEAEGNGVRTPCSNPASVVTRPFVTGDSVLAVPGGSIAINGQTLTNCWFVYAPYPGIVYNGILNPIWPQQKGYSLCEFKTPGTVNGLANIQISAFPNPHRFVTGQSMAAFAIVFDNGSYCFEGCWVLNAGMSGYAYGKPGQTSVSLNPTWLEVNNKTLVKP